MSLAEDEDFGAKIVEHCAKIIVTEVGKLVNLLVEKQERQRLLTRVQSLETE
ncbi:hypothetical protein DPMN_104003 [Dreissena polymorpha]|uniref:Uncharacterized protein n=1 Tax=Dreissena polymorpha TaxID=45954 RepID=A0A9D4H6T1_DREPO|nr:hypothetical protein DPMN_103910 [Dreissena polymorpha]KAH3830751.1 hypothetical protein DPMN_104003 [Dreissena polymorpha]